MIRVIVNFIIKCEDREEYILTECREKTVGASLYLGSVEVALEQ